MERKIPYDPDSAQNSPIDINNLTLPPFPRFSGRLKEGQTIEVDGIEHRVLTKEDIKAISGFKIEEEAAA